MLWAVLIVHNYDGIKLEGKNHHCNMAEVPCINSKLFLAFFVGIVDFKGCKSLKIFQIIVRKICKYCGYWKSYSNPSEAMGDEVH